MIDYDGAFYPPAIEDYRKNPDVFARSVLVGKTVHDLGYDSRYKIRDVINDWKRTGSFYYEAVVDDICRVVDVSSSYDLGNGISVNVDHTYSDCVVDGNLRSVVGEWFGRFDFKDENFNIDSVDYRDLVKTIQGELKKGPFERYYSHLGFKETERVKTYNQLVEYRQDIFDITDRHVKKDVWDIFRYGLDVGKNSYILYKKYDSEDPSFVER